VGVAAPATGRGQLEDRRPDPDRVIWRDDPAVLEATHGVEADPGGQRAPRRRGVGGRDREAPVEAGQEPAEGRVRAVAIRCSGEAQLGHEPILALLWMAGTELSPR
jgi:hypothetical protein